MPAYVIVDIHVTDPGRYEEYKKLAAPSLEQFGGRYLARGGAVEILEGDWKPGRTVIVEFPSVARAKEWWSSAAYAPIKKIRQSSATTKMLVVQGVS